MINLGAIGALLQNWRLLLGAGVLVAIVSAYAAGGNAERKRGEARQLRVEIETIRRDQSITQSAADDAKHKADELAALAKSQENELDALRKQLAARPQADRDIAPADALDRLYPGK